MLKEIEDQLVRWGKAGNLARLEFQAKRVLLVNRVNQALRVSLVQLDHVDKLDQLGLQESVVDQENKVNLAIWKK